MNASLAKLREGLRALRIFNNHGLLSYFGKDGGDVAIEYSHSGTVRPRGSRVWSPSRAMDPDAHFFEYGAKWFSGKQADSMPKAIEWASARTGVTGWATSPFGGKVPKVVVDAALAAVKEKA